MPEKNGIGEYIWQDDSKFDNCKSCGNKFSAFNRRHHCRRCGDIFCSKCSEEYDLKYFQVKDKNIWARWEKYYSRRLCKKCYEPYENRKPDCCHNCKKPIVCNKGYDFKCFVCKKIICRSCIKWKHKDEFSYFEKQYLFKKIKHLHLKNGYPFCKFCFHEYYMHCVKCGRMMFPGYPNSFDAKKYKNNSKEFLPCFGCKLCERCFPKHKKISIERTFYIWNNQYKYFTLPRSVETPVCQDCFSEKEVLQHNILKKIHAQIKESSKQNQKGIIYLIGHHHNETSRGEELLALLIKYLSRYDNNLLKKIQLLFEPNTHLTREYNSKHRQISFGYMRDYLNEDKALMRKFEFNTTVDSKGALRLNMPLESVITNLSTEKENGKFNPLAVNSPYESPFYLYHFCEKYSIPCFSCETDRFQKVSYNDYKYFNKNYINKELNGKDTYDKYKQKKGKNYGDNHYRHIRMNASNAFIAQHTLSQHGKNGRNITFVIYGLAHIIDSNERCKIANYRSIQYYLRYHSDSHKVSRTNDNKWYITKYSSVKIVTCLCLEKCFVSHKDKLGFLKFDPRLLDFRFIEKQRFAKLTNINKLKIQSPSDIDYIYFS